MNKNILTHTLSFDGFALLLKIFVDDSIDFTRHHRKNHIGDSSWEKFIYLVAEIELKTPAEEMPLISFQTLANFDLTLDDLKQHLNNLQPDPSLQKLYPIKGMAKWFLDFYAATQEQDYDPADYEIYDQFKKYRVMWESVNTFYGRNEVYIYRYDDINVIEVTKQKEDGSDEYYASFFDIDKFLPALNETQQQANREVERLIRRKQRKRQG